MKKIKKVLGVLIMGCLMLGILSSTDDPELGDRGGEVVSIVFEEEI